MPSRPFLWSASQSKRSRRMWAELYQELVTYVSSRRKKDGSCTYCTRCHIANRIEHARNTVVERCPPKPQVCSRRICNRLARMRFLIWPHGRDVRSDKGFEATFVLHWIEHIYIYQKRSERAHVNAFKRHTPWKTLWVGVCKCRLFALRNSALRTVPNATTLALV